MNNIFMKAAIKEAKKAFLKNEVPVGAVVVKNGEIIAKAHNLCEKNGNPLQHAEILAINKALKKLNENRLNGCELYVTLEPCPMCAGAIINARLDEVVFGAFDLKGGAVSSKCDLFNKGFNHKPIVFEGICETECANLLTEFFKDKR